MVKILKTLIMLLNKMVIAFDSTGLQQLCREINALQTHLYIICTGLLQAFAYYLRKLSKIAALSGVKIVAFVPPEN
jgi:hypothetical protein